MSECIPSKDCLGDSTCRSEEDAIRANEMIICSFAKFGNYTKPYAEAAEDFKAAGCPDGQVMADFIMNISIPVLHRAATLNARGCFQGCIEDSDCHGYNVKDNNIKDENGNPQQSQLRCMATSADATTNNKAKVCFDARSVEHSSIGITFVDTSESTNPVNSDFVMYHD